MCRVHFLPKSELDLLIRDLDSAILKSSPCSSPHIAAMQ